MADTPWGELTINDAHVHFFSRSFYDGLARQAESLKREPPMTSDWEIPSTRPEALPNRWVAELDSCGVNRACLIASIPGDETSVSAAVAQHPDRFFGFFMLDPTQPDALERLERAASDRYLHCLCLFPAMHRFSVAEDRIRPVWEAAARGGLAVFVHCGALSVGIRKRYGLPSLFDLRFSNPLDLHPVALRFPGVKIIVPHFGAGMLRETLMLADLCPNVLLDTSSSNGWMAYEGLDLQRVFRRALDVVGAERILFGTDSSFFPRGWQRSVFEQQAQALYALGVKRPEASRILGGNLTAVFSTEPDHR